MRSEAEIRKQVDARFRRWIGMAINAGLWAAVALGLYFFSDRADVPQDLVGPAIIFMVVWGVMVGLHFLYSVNQETHEAAVRRAIEREREFYLLKLAYEKRKHDDALPDLTDDGELIDFDGWQDEAVKVKAEYE